MSALKSKVPGSLEAVLMPPPTVGLLPKLGHLTRAMMPWRFYVQLSTDDLHMLFMPPWFQHVLQEWIKIPLPCSVQLYISRFCDEWVQVTYHGGQVVFGRN
jgi:hypothetical protein